MYVCIYIYIYISIRCSRKRSPIASGGTAASRAANPALYNHTNDNNDYS